MLIKSEHSESLAPKADGGLFARVFHRRYRHHLRPRDAPLGAAGLIAIVGGALMIPLAESFAGSGAGAARALSVIILLFGPAILAAVYSLFFENAKIYGILDLALSGITLLLHSVSWYWLEMYLPFAGAFTIFCAVVRVLGTRDKESS